MKQHDSDDLHEAATCMTQFGLRGAMLQDFLYKRVLLLFYTAGQHPIGQKEEEKLHNSGKTKCCPSVRR